MFCLDVRESGANVGWWRIREGIKGVLHKKIERKGGRKKEGEGEGKKKRKMERTKGGRMEGRRQERRGGGRKGRRW